MVQPNVTADDVLTAVEEFDRLGRHEFLTKYGYGEARSYFLNHNGRFYDSKAIVGVAHHIRHGEALTPKEFSGGDATVAALLRKLGFVVSKPNPARTWDEIVLACDLARQNNWRSLDDTAPAVIELSDLLQQLPIHPHEMRGPTFRNPKEIARKTVDIATQHPDYSGTAKHGSKLEAEVLHEFKARGWVFGPQQYSMNPSATTSSSSSTSAGNLDRRSGWWIDPAGARRGPGRHAPRPLPGGVGA